MPLFEAPLPAFFGRPEAVGCYFLSHLGTRPPAPPPMAKAYGLSHPSNSCLVLPSVQRQLSTENLSRT